MVARYWKPYSFGSPTYVPLALISRNSQGVFDLCSLRSGTSGSDFWGCHAGCEAFGRNLSDICNIWCDKSGEIGGEDFPPANQALNISGRISGNISEKVSETSFQILFFFSVSFSRSAVLADFNTSYQPSAQALREHSHVAMCWMSPSWATEATLLQQGCQEQRHPPKLFTHSLKFCKLSNRALPHDSASPSIGDSYQT